MGLLRRRQAAPLRLFYASDVHGSDLCWRKFLNAATHYACGALVMGGDLTGKALVPIVRRNGSFVAQVVGEERVARDAKELEELERAIRHNGFYVVHASVEDVQSMRDDVAVRERIFEQAMRAELERWLEIADQRLASAEVGVFVMPGNDDPWFVDEVLARPGVIKPCDGRIVNVGEHEMLSFGWSNPTPWKSPRELPEEELYTRVRALAEELRSPATAIFNLHAPPFNSGLDTATELDAELRPVLRGGQPHEIPVGSTAVRQLIEEFQPALALHGHIHESRGITRIGKTVAINPGSDYAGGRIDGCVVDLGPAGVERQQLVSG